MGYKRYDQFAAGTYDASRLILTGDPSTGALESLPLGDLPTGGLPIVTFPTGFTNTGNAAEQFWSYTIPANTLATDGDSLDFFFQLNKNNGTNTVPFNFSFGGTNLTQTLPITNAPVNFQGTIMRLTSTTAWYWWFSYRGATINGSASVGIAGLNYTTTINTYVNPATTEVGVVVGRFGRLTFYLQ